MTEITNLQQENTSTSRPEVMVDAYMVIRVWYLDMWLPARSALEARGSASLEEEIIAGCGTPLLEEHKLVEPL